MRPHILKIYGGRGRGRAKLSRASVFTYYVMETADHAFSVTTQYGDVGDC